MHGSLATHGSLAEAAKVQHEKSKDDKVWADGMDMDGLPSGKLLHNYGKSPFIVIFPMNNCDFP